MSLDVGIAMHLAENVDGIEFEPDTWDGTLYLAHMPSKPDIAVMLMPTGGPPVFNGGATHGYDEATMQIMVRGEAHDGIGPKTMAQDISNALTGLHNVTLDGTYIVRTLALQSVPSFLNTDENERFRFVQNFSFHIRNQSVHRK